MSRMFSALQQLAASAFMERLTLWLNHVIAGEDAAVQRLRPHAGRLVRLELSGWPTLLPPLPEISFGITPAGLLEWNATALAAPPDLPSVRIFGEPIAAAPPPFQCYQAFQSRLIFLASDHLWTSVGPS